MLTLASNTRIVYNSGMEKEGYISSPNDEEMTRFGFYPSNEADVREWESTLPPHEIPAIRDYTNDPFEIGSKPADMGLDEETNVFGFGQMGDEEYLGH